MKIKKNQHKVKLFVWILTLVMAVPAWAQQGDKVTLERADELVKDENNPDVKKLIRRVIIRHKGTVLYCDSAYLHEDKNAVDAFGHARLNGEDGTRLTSDSMFYNGDTEIARAVGNVVLIDDQTRLTTNELDYNLEEGVAYYYSGGKLVDSEKTLESQAGSYDTNSKIFYFKKDVELITKKEGRKINTDDLTFNTISNIAYFQGPTWIETKKGRVYTESGNFNTETEVSNFRGRTKIEDDIYILEGDSIFFNNSLGAGFAKGKVQLFSKKDSVLLNGDEGWVRREIGEAKIYSNALMRSITEGDTLYLRADTLYTIDRKKDSLRLMLAYPESRIFKKDFQGRCDSLVYNRLDSTINMFRDPVLWNEDSQLSADSVKIFMANNKIEKLNMRVNSFMVSRDSLANYNQLKGKIMTAYFRRNQIRKVDVRGNAQNIYFVLEGDTLMTGMNRVACSDMDIYFKEKNKLQKIAYLNKADAIFVPPHELQDPQRRFKGFTWRQEERPNREEMLELIISAEE